jgi:hypothetical protein
VLDWRLGMGSTFLYHNIILVSRKGGESNQPLPGRLIKKESSQRCPQIKQIKSVVIVDIFDTFWHWICCLRYLIKHFKCSKSQRRGSPMLFPASQWGYLLRP